MPTISMPPAMPAEADDSRITSDKAVISSVLLPVPNVERPILRYHGGKWLLAPWIISQMPEHKIYVEPFAGAASVLLRKPRCYAEIYNDMDGEIVNLFRVVKDCGDELRRAIELTPYSRADFSLSYEPNGNPVEQARRTAARFSMGFGTNSMKKTTGFRASSTQSGQTPANDWRKYPENLGAIIERLRGVTIENKEAVEIIQTHDTPETLFYVDPPYVASTRDAGTDYRHELTDEQHRTLVGVLNTVKGMVMVSGYPSELYDEIFAGWKRLQKKTVGDANRERTEVLWLRNVETHGMLPGLDG